MVHGREVSRVDGLHLLAGKQTNSTQVMDGGRSLGDFVLVEGRVRNSAAALRI